jgi:hypothetical protein
VGRELDQLKAEHEALGRRIAELEGKPAPKAPPPEEGVRITSPPTPSTLIMPNPDEFDRLLAIVLAKYPSLALPLELSFVERLTARNTGAVIKPDEARIRAEFRREVEAAFIAIGAMKISDALDRRHYVSFHVENAQAWLKSFNRFADITGNAFIVAALMHGTVPFTAAAKNTRRSAQSGSLVFRSMSASP